MIINPKSLHYRLYTYYSSGSPADLRFQRTNFCQYARTVMVGMLLVLAIILFVSIVLVGPMQVIGTFSLWWITDNPLIPFITLVDGTMLGTIGQGSIVVIVMEIFASLFYLVSAIISFTKNTISSIPAKEKEPGFIKTWYLSRKEKFCPYVTLADNDET